MKLRVRGNSIRFRVSRRELGRIVEEGAAEDAAAFPGGAELRYRVEVADGPLAAELSGTTVRLKVPRDEIARWSRPEEVTIRGEQPIGGGASLKILLEKDFACLAPRADEEEDEADLFPHPQAGSR